jgi:hypothetical protein
MDFDDLDDDERQLMDEINFVQDKGPRVVRKPAPSRAFRKEQRIDPGDEDIDAFVNDSKMEAARPPPVEEWDGGEPPVDHEQPQRNIPTGPSEGYKTIEDEKADLLNKIARLAKKGIQTTARLNIYSDVEDIRTEFKRMSYSVEVDQSVKFQRRMLVACVSGIEFLNKKFDPFDLELDGWSENVMESQEDYDTVFEELFAKYRSKVAVAPELKLMFMVGGSAMMFHLSKSMVKKFVQTPMKFPTMNQGQGQSQAPQTQGSGRDMRGPGIDLTSLGGGFDISSLLGAMNQAERPREPQEEELSDIISIGSEVKDLEVSSTGEPRRRKRTKKKELVL